MKQTHNGSQGWRHRSSSSVASTTPPSAAIAVTMPSSSSSEKTSSPLVTQQTVLSTASPGIDPSSDDLITSSKTAYSELTGAQPRSRDSGPSSQGTENSRLSKQGFKFNPFQPQQPSFCFLNLSELKTQDNHRGRPKDIEFRRTASLSCVPQMDQQSRIQRPLISLEEEKAEERRRKQRCCEMESEEWRKLILMIPRESLIGSVDCQIKLMDKCMFGKYDKSLEKLTKLPADLKLKKSICRIVQVSGKEKSPERNFVIEKLSTKDAAHPKFKKVVDLNKIEKAKRCWDERTQAFAIGLIPKSDDDVVFLKVVPQRKTADLLVIIEKMIDFLAIQKLAL